MVFLGDLPSECLQQCFPAERVHLGLVVCRAWREQLLCRVAVAQRRRNGDKVPVVELRARQRAFGAQGTATRATALLSRFKRPGAPAEARRGAVAAPLLSALHAAHGAGPLRRLVGATGTRVCACLLT